MASELNRLTAREVLDLVPQRPPFRFIDDILELDEQHIIGRYTFKANESFYAGHFPGNPITPGVILIEAMAQVGVVALGIFLKTLEVPLDEARKYTTMFTDARAEFFGMVRPEEQVTSRAEPVFWRRNKLQSKVEMTGPDGKIIATAVVSGLGVKI